MILRSLPYRILSVLLILAALLPLGMVVAEAEAMSSPIAAGSNLSNLQPASNSTLATSNIAAFSGRDASGAPLTVLPWFLGMLALLGIAMATGVVQV